MAATRIPVDTTGLIEARERRFRIARALFALALLVFLLGGGYILYGAGARLEQAGWGKYLGVRGSSPFDTAIACIGNGGCLAVLPKAFPMPLWWPLTAATLFALGALFTYASAAALRPQKLPGAARFRENWRELTKGISYLGVKEGQVLRYPKDLRFRHTLIIGSTGAGKTSRLIRPMLAYTALEGRSAVIFDLKYPDTALLSMVQYAESKGLKVMLYLPYDPRSPRLPLLRGAEDPEIARALAEVIIPVKEKAGVTTYYENIERELVFWLIHLEAMGKGSLGHIRYQCQLGAKSLRDYIKRNAEDAEKALGFFFGLSERDQASIVAGLVGKLGVFGDELLDRATSYGDNELDLRQIAREPTVFYLGIPHDKLQDRGGQLFLQLLKRYLDSVLIEESKERGRVKVPVEVYLDEFTNLGYLPRMSDNLSTMRSRGVAYVLALQSLSQGLERYEEEELESIMANCNTWIILPGLGDKDSERFSEAIGYGSMYLKTEGELEPHWLDFQRPWGSFSQNYRLQQVPLISPEELRALPAGQVVLRFSTGDPLIAEAPRIDEAASGGRGIPKELRNVAREVMALEAKLEPLTAISNEFAAEYVISKYLSPISGEEEAPLGAPTEEPKAKLMAWVEESLLRGAQVKVHRNPAGQNITKITIYPPAGLAPKEAAEWERAKWVKLEKGGTAISLVGSALEAFLASHPQLVEYADAVARVQDWLEANGYRVLDHPLYRPGEDPVGRYQGKRLALHQDVLAELGLSVEDLRRFTREVRLQNRRGFLELDLDIGEWYRRVKGNVPSGEEGGAS
jgi:type IV secretion system protein VirD4